LKSTWAVVNHSSNPAIEAVINGIPVFVSESSLCHDVGNTNVADILHPAMPARQNWANRMSYTEWTTEEIGQGLPWKGSEKDYWRNISNENSKSPGQRNEVLPIEWKPYTGETVIVKTVIRGGKKIQETAYYEDL
jgi:hypothetical protein